MDDLLTTRQLQDLLQVDRVTIYRMLADGRLQGVKVGGQWRFPRRRIEAWFNEQAGEAAREPTPAVVEGRAPSQILPASCVQAIQAVCAEALDVAVVTIDPAGSPLTPISNSCEFCNLILSTDRGYHACSAAWRQLDDGQLHLCHAGLLCASAPVWVSGRWVAISAACQFTPPKADGGQAWRANIPRLAGELGVAEHALRPAAGGVPVLSMEQVHRVPTIVQRVAATFSEIGHERLGLLGRLQHIAEISKI